MSEEQRATIRVGSRHVPRDEALKHAADYLGAKPPLAWSYPAYDSYDAERAQGPLIEADLLAPALLNVERTSVTTYYRLRDALSTLQLRLDALRPDVSLVDAQQPDLDALGALYAVLDETEEVDRNDPDAAPPARVLEGTQGTRLSKILHRKRPALIPLYDERVRRCYQDNGADKPPVPPVKGRTWGEFMPLFAAAVREDLRTQLDTWEEIANLAGDPRTPITSLRALDIVAWKAGAL